MPTQLALGIPAWHTKVSRDPSTESLRFPRLRHGEPQQYAISNLRAAWLLDGLAQRSPFAGLPPGQRLLALQSAMFMIGYWPLRFGDTSIAL